MALIEKPRAQSRSQAAGRGGLGRTPLRMSQRRLDSATQPMVPDGVLNAATPRGPEAVADAVTGTVLVSMLKPDREPERGGTAMIVVDD